MCIDAENAEEIADFLEDKKVRDKFDYIVNRILEQPHIHYEGGYEKLQSFKDMSEFRIFPNGMNARIYCKEVLANEGNFYVIAAKFVPKKKDFDKKLIAFIKPIEDYTYDTKELPRNRK